MLQVFHAEMKMNLHDRLGKLKLGHYLFVCLALDLAG